MAPFPDKAGSASALFSSIGSALGALSGFILSLFHAKSAVPMASLLALCYVLPGCYYYYFGRLPNSVHCMSIPSHIENPFDDTLVREGLSPLTETSMNLGIAQKILRL